MTRFTHSCFFSMTVNVKVPWDDEIGRAIVIIRNPMQAIPSFFNHIYEMKNHLPVHSERAPVEAWIEWRDRFAAAQIAKYASFVNYVSYDVHDLNTCLTCRCITCLKCFMQPFLLREQWMERFAQHDENRIFISYERLTSDDKGPEEAIRITKFLAQSEGVKPIDIDSVPCVWRAVVKYKEAAASNLNQRKLDDGRRRLDPLHHDSQRSGPTERPYTPELLAAISQMLLELIEKWGERHLRLQIILEGYQRDVHDAYVAASRQSQKVDANAGVASIESISGNSADGVVDPQPPPKPFHIIQSSFPHTGSTVLNNFLIGLFEPEADYAFMIDSLELPVLQRGLKVPIETTIVTKTHNVDLLFIYKK